MKKTLFSLSALSLSLLAGGSFAAVAPEVDPLANPPSPAFAGQTRASAAVVAHQVQVLASGLQQPRSLQALPDGRLLVATGTGELRLLTIDGQLSEPLEGLPPIRSVNGRSLNDFILAQDFAQSRTVFFTYAAPPPGEPGGPVSAEARAAAQAAGEVFQLNQVARARLSDDDRRLEDVEVIAEVAGRRLFSAPDGTLFISTMGFGAEEPEVQKLTTPIGKFLRINADGSVPADNPYAGRSLARQDIFSFGHRDPDGLFLHPETGELWSVEHGPMGGDELNVIRPGRNYGWPYVTYGKNYDGSEIGPSSRHGVEQPVYYWFPSIAPSGLLLYSGDLFPAWKGNFFLGAMSPTQGKFLVRLVMQEGKVLAEEQLLTDRDRRVRAVAQGADGAIYVLTDSEANDQLGRHFPGEVLRLSPRD